MHFETGHTYHIYNQGNNRRPIFLRKENYRYFLEKVKLYILPFADILAYCLMPNHFHLMIFVNRTELVNIFPNDKAETNRTLNDSIGIMLRSYTRAINNEQNWSGSLFRKETKAICLSQAAEPSETWTTINRVKYIINDSNEINYMQVCFRYIYNNPIKANLVNKPILWDYSSAKEYFTSYSPKIINKQKAIELELIINDD